MEDENKQDIELLAVINEETQIRLFERINSVSHLIGKFDSKSEWEEQGASKMDSYLRFALWEEASSAAKEGRYITVSNIYKDVCTKATLYGRLARDYSAAFIFTKPVEFKVKQMVMLNDATERLKDIVSHKVDYRGKLNTIDLKLAELHFKVAKYLDERIRGATIQRIQQHTVNQHVAGEISIQGIKNISDLDAQIESLEKETAKVIEIDK